MGGRESMTTTESVQAGSTERVRRLRERLLATTPSLCAERGRLFTEAYEEHAADPVVLRRAKALGPRPRQYDDSHRGRRDHCRQPGQRSESSASVPGIRCGFPCRRDRRVPQSAGRRFPREPGCQEGDSRNHRPLLARTDSIRARQGHTAGSRKPGTGDRRHLRPRQHHLG